MKSIGSASFILLLFSFSVIIISGLVPIPHYMPEKGWYNGPSFFSRLLGEKEEGISAEKIYFNFAKSNLESPFKLTCQTDLDCKNYKVLSQCKSYCGNSDDGSEQVIDKLNKNRVCDPAGWKAPVQDCRCILGSCLDINE